MVLGRVVKFMLNSMFKQFKVEKKVKENDVVTSFYLKPANNTELKVHNAGQFISIKPIKTGENSDEMRQYSLSMKPGSEFYRISVKREDKGLISNYMHNEVNEGDIVSITDPVGIFTLKDSDRPLVLISGGIGVTPVMSMLYKGVESNRQIIFAQAVINSNVHTFKEEVNNLSLEHENLKTTIFYSNPLEEDKLGIDYDYEGHITKEWIIGDLPRNGDFYFCGPLGFMKHIFDCLTEMGISKEYIHYEAFGPAKDLSKI